MRRRIRDRPTSQVHGANRDFMRRVGRYLATELGFRQFLDIGTDLPTSPNLHEVVQQVAPEARIVYVDNDPIVLTHARALLTSSHKGKTAYIDADLRDPATIINSSQTRETLDFSKPVALSLIAIVHFMPDDDEVHRIIREFMAVLPEAARLPCRGRTAIVPRKRSPRASPPTMPTGFPENPQHCGGRGAVRRTRPRRTRCCPVNHWRPDDQMPPVLDEHVHICGGVAVKP